MKKIMLAVVILVATADSGYSQTVNWGSLSEDQQNVIQLTVGYDYGVTAQFGYSRAFTLIRPVLFGLDYSMPMGQDVFDDFKIRLGAQIEIFELGEFSATAKVLSNFRRYENAMVRIAGFGADLGVVAGYYTPSWYAAGEFGFDKAITSNLKHSDIMKASFPGITDGWYVPTGGNYYYGIQGGKSLGESLDISLRLGVTNAQANDKNAVLPVYFQLGLGVKF